MSNKPQNSKTNITKISAKSAAPKATAEPTASPELTSESTAKPAEASQSANTAQQSTKNNTKFSKKHRKSPKTRKNQSTTEKPLKEVFLLARPFVAFGRYLRDSWREIRQVRWPNRKATWKMTLAVLIYCAIFMIFILILDAFFTFIFNLILGTN